MHSSEASEFRRTQEVPVEVQTREREAFFERARKRIAKIHEDRDSEVQSLEEAAKKLADPKAVRTVQATVARVF